MKYLFGIIVLAFIWYIAHNYSLTILCTSSNPNVNQQACSELTGNKPNRANSLESYYEAY